MILSHRSILSFRKVLAATCIILALLLLSGNAIAQKTAKPVLHG